MAGQVDAQRFLSGAIASRIQDNALNKAADDFSRFLAAALIIQSLAQPANLFAVAIAHPRMNQPAKGLWRVGKNRERSSGP